jgi:hypothetical protein
MLLPIFVGWLISPDLIGDTALLIIVLAVFCICLIIYVVTFGFGIATMDKRINQVELQGLNQLEEAWG